MLDKVKKAIKSLKNNKADRKDGLPAELLKLESKQLYKHLHCITLTIWEEEQLPTNWLNVLTVLIYPLHKKGHRLESANYLGITLLKSTQSCLTFYLTD